MILTTTIDIPKGPFGFGYEEPIMLMGSCFAENIGKRLSDNQFKTDLNPFGTLYNPASVASALKRLLHPAPFTTTDLFQQDGVYHSFAHHSRFSSTSEADCLEQINNRLNDSATFLTKASRLIITFGTAYVYQLKSSGEVVANCHKLPEKLFERSMLSVETITEEWQILLQQLWQHNPLLKVLFTVSPIRHWKDGAHGNQLSKATLLLVIDQLQQRFPKQIHYFPAYELMMDELRDYRFYADDMLHPSAVAVEYIWQRMVDTFFSDEAKAFMKAWAPIKRGLAHRPLNPDSAEYKAFHAKLMADAEALKRRYPDMPF